MASTDASSTSTKMPETGGIDMNSDPDGNGWLLQEIRTRLPGRTWED